MVQLQKYFDTAIESPDGIKKLRELILTLAMQGKLVPQDPNDEPAIVLFNDIQKTNKSLVLSKANNQLETFPCINEYIPYELPNGWMWCKMGDIGFTNIGLTYSPSDLSDEGIPVLRSNNIKNGKLLLTDLKRVDVPVKESVIAEEGDLLICARNGSKALVGKTAIISGLPERMAFGAFMAIFRSRINEYLLHFIHSPLFRTMIDETNTMTINQITQNNLKTTMFPLPPLNEQKRIVKKIDQLMAACDKLESLQKRRDTTIFSAHSASIKRLLSAVNADELSSSWHFISKHFDTFYSVKENVAELKKAILTLAMQGKLVPQNIYDTPVTELLNDIRKSKSDSTPITNIFNNQTDRNLTTEFLLTQIPQTWKWVRLEDYAELIMGQSPQSSSYNDKKEGLPFFQGKADFGDISPKVSTWCSSPQKIAPPNSILISVRAPVGPTNICPFEACIGRGLAAINCLAGADNMYLLYYLRSIEGVIASYGTGSTFKAITKKVLQNLMVPVPPIEEQKRIVKIVESLFELCDNLIIISDITSTKHTQLLDSIFNQVTAS